MNTALRACAKFAGVLAIVVAMGVGAFAQDKSATTLFKVITAKDDIVIGLTAEELKAIGGNDAGAVAKALAAKGELTVWQQSAERRPAAGAAAQDRAARQQLVAGRALFDPTRRASARVSPRGVDDERRA